MNREQLKVLGRALHRELDAGQLSIDLYFQDGEQWRVLPPAEYALLDGEKHGAEPVRAGTHKAHAEANALWFEMPGVRAAASLRFETTPDAAIVDVCETRIGAILQNAVNAYRVSHNPLTGLLARDSFNRILKDKIRKIRDDANLGRTVQEGGKSPLLSVIAFDLDRFKQVNDNFGHLYGDQVLKTFARRLDRIATALMRGHGEQIDIRVAHPSGEEYLVLIEGAVDSAQIGNMAETFCSRIQEEPLPSESEWHDLVRQQPEIQEIVFPASSERHLTASVGVALYTPNQANSPDAEVMSLLDDADTALARSKMRGRNQVTVFDNIIVNCARVLEHDVQTAVTAIDIGLKVGVAVGQEFIVYPSTFGGKTPFVTDDGRTRKVVGFYPKMELARVVVFNVQNEIAFALPVDRARPVAIPPGSQLEAVPLGSISHLVAGPGDAGASGAGPEGGLGTGTEAFGTAVMTALRAGNLPAAAVFRFKGAAGFTRKFGTAAFDRNLAKLYSDLNQLFPGVTVGLIDQTSVCVVGPDASITTASLRKALLECAASNDLDLICGYFIAETSTASVGHKMVDPRYAVDFAQYAVSDHGLDGLDSDTTRLICFDLARARALLKALVAVRAAQGIVDYERFNEAHFAHHTLDNLGGVCYSKLDRLDKATDCYEMAIRKSVRDVMYRGNLSIVAYRTNQHERALTWLNDLDDEQLQELRKSSPNGFLSYAMHLVQAQRLNLPGFVESRLLEIGPLALQSPQLAKFDNGTVHLRDALEKCGSASLTSRYRTD